MKYERNLDAKHISSTEDALKHWDMRRAKDQTTITVPTQNIGQLTNRLDALFRAVHDLELSGLDISKAHVLDVGAAQGYGLRPFLELGFSVPQLHGIDLFADRIAEGKRRIPGIDLIEGDASNMPYPDESFDVVCEQFCFCHIPDDQIKPKIAREMLRVVKPGGFIIIHDWRIGSEQRKLYGMSAKKIRSLFGLSIVGRYRSQLYPMLGRPISKYAPFLYGLVKLISPLTGSWITVLRKE